MIPRHDQVLVQCEGNDVYTFQPFGQDSCGFGCAPDGISQIRTSEGWLHACRRCSAVKFVPHERTTGGYVTQQEKARRVLVGFLEEDGSLTDDGGCWVWWENGPEIEIDGSLNADQLEAIGWWIRNTSGKRT